MRIRIYPLAVFIIEQLILAVDCRGMLILQTVLVSAVFRLAFTNKGGIHVSQARGSSAASGHRGNKGWRVRVSMVILLALSVEIVDLARLVSRC
jgi:hypothetical protein